MTGELRGWLFVGVLVTIAFLAALEIAGVVEDVFARRQEKETTAYCKEVRQERWKRQRGAKP